MCNRQLLSMASLVLLLSGFPAQAQLPEPSPPAPEKPASTAESSNKNKNGTKPSSKHAHDFLIKGTVFTQDGLSFSGARIQIRKEGEKKFRWQDSANSRGEFAIRVIRGAKYEVVVSGKGCKDQQKTVDATGSDRVEEIVLHMEREGNKPS